MNTAFECIPCFVRQAVKAVEMAGGDGPRKARLLRQLLRDIAGADWNVLPVSIAQRIQRSIRAATGATDPYRDLKDRMNRMAMNLLPALHAALARQPDPRVAVVRLAIAGNLLDAGAKTQIPLEDLPRHLDAIWQQPLCGDMAALFQAAERAHCILYLADNAGEIVFDRLLIEALPAEKITVFVRGAPVLNDATLADAAVAGLPEIAPVFDNGSDAPGTLLTDCSENFRAWFERADLILAKGQGNYETLVDAPKNIFFLFTVNCPVVARLASAAIGSLMVLPGGKSECGTIVPA